MDGGGSLKLYETRIAGSACARTVPELVASEIVPPRRGANDRKPVQAADGASAAAGHGGLVDQRKMRQARLLGQHTHETVCGQQVHVWTRGGKYLARGRH